MHRLRFLPRALPRAPTLIRSPLLQRHFPSRNGRSQDIANLHRPHLRTRAAPFSTATTLHKNQEKGGKPRGSHKGTVEGGAPLFIPEEHWAKMEATLEKTMIDLNKRLSYLKRGIADPRRLSAIMVRMDRDGVTVPLDVIAHVTSKGRNFAIHVHEEKNVQKAISAIHNAGLNLHPVVDHANPTKLLVPLPPPTKEWRHEVGTNCHNAGMLAQNAINKARGDFHRSLASSRKQLRPDDYTKWEKKLFPITRKYKDDATAAVVGTRDAILEEAL